MPVQDLPHPREVVVGRDDHAARPLHRLGQERGDGLRALAHDRLFQEARRRRAGPLAGSREVAAVRVMRAHVEELGEPRPEHARVVGNAGRAHAGDRRAVVAVLERDDLDLRRPALAPPEVARGLERRLVRVDAARREEARLEPRVRDRLEARRQLERGRVGEAAVRVGEGEAAHLVRGRLDQFLAPVAQVDVPEAGQPVDVRAALGVLEMDASAPDEDGETPTVRRIGHGMEVALVERRVARGHRPLLGRECPGPARRRVAGSWELTPANRGRAAGPCQGAARRCRTRSPIVVGCLDSRDRVAILAALSGARCSAISSSDPSSWSSSCSSCRSSSSRSCA